MNPFLFTLVLLLSATRISVAQSETLAQLLASRDDLSIYSTAVQLFPDIFALVSSNNYTLTIFAPTNDLLADNAIFAESGNVWQSHLREIVKKSIVSGEEIPGSALSDDSRTFLQTLGESVQVVSRLGTLEESRVIETDLLASNGILHILDRPLLPTLMTDNFVDLIGRRSEYGGDGTTPSFLQVSQLVGGDTALGEFRSGGATFVGCSVTAMANVNEDLPTSFSGGTDTLNDDFLNAQDTDRIFNQVIEYNILTENFYSDALSDGFVGVTLPAGGCGHMFVTKTGDQLCFNNACVESVNSNLKEFLMGSGVAYVTDKCLSCAGAAMLVQYAFSYAALDSRDISTLFSLSGWNLRNLQSNVGNGGPVTVFAPVTSTWDGVSTADQARLRTDGWTLHGNDVLEYIMVQGVFTVEDLYRIYQEEKRAYPITAINGDDIVIDYDAGRDRLTINGGDINVANLKAADGLLHLTEHVPIPRSLSQSLYEVAKSNPTINAHIKLVEDNSETLRLVLDVQTPITALFVKNDIWGGKGYNTERIAGDILESQVFDNMLLSCDDLVALAGSNLTSINGMNWTVSVNDETGLPCFDFADENVDGLEAFQSCVAECNILGKNGIGHAMSGISSPPGVIQPYDPTASPTPLPTSVEDRIPSPAPSDSSVWLDYDLQGCLIDLSQADADQDGAIRRNEFYSLLALYGKRVCYVVEESLNARQLQLFFDIACLCKEEENSSDDCCEGSNAFIDTRGRLISNVDSYKEAVCRQVHAGIGANCGGNGPGDFNGGDGSGNGSDGTEDGSGMGSNGSGNGDGSANNGEGGENGSGGGGSSSATSSLRFSMLADWSIFMVTALVLSLL